MMDVMEKNGKPAMKGEEANMHIQKFFTAMMDRKADAAVSKGKEFLEKNGKREGVTTTASGLQYEVMKMGTGDKPAATDEVTVHYHGTLTDGKVFDSSVERGDPATFPLNGVIKGWTEALQLMPVGSKFKIFLPGDLAYGAQGAGEMIGPHETLIFEVELLKINKK
jgi:FKBP-type peptidyl-prolyl cis-trans isomerase FklB